MRMKKRQILSLLTVLALMFNIAPVSSLAEETDYTYSSDPQTVELKQTEPAEEVKEYLSAGEFSYQGRDYTVRVAYDENALFPVGTELKVREIYPWTQEYRDLTGITTEYAEDDWSKIDNFMRFFDITFVCDGEEIEPSSEIQVSIDFVNAIALDEETSLQVLHFDAENNINTVSSDISENSDANAEAVSFSSDAFSVYCVVRVREVITKNLPAANGRTYQINIEYGQDSGIQETSEIRAQEIREGTAAYEEYRRQIVDTIGSDAQDVAISGLYDISIWNGDEKVNPDADVKVSVKLLEEGAIPEDENLRVIHFEGENETPVEIEDFKVEGDTVSFSTDGFSVFAIAYTVDLSYEDLNGLLHIDFTGYDVLGAEASPVVYDTAECDIHVSSEWLASLLQTAENTEDGISAETENGENFRFDFTKAQTAAETEETEATGTETGLRYADGVLTIPSDGTIRLTDGKSFLTIRITNLTALKEEILNAEGVSVEIVEGNVPLGSEIQYTARTEEETQALVTQYLSKDADESIEEAVSEEEKVQTIAGYGAADLKIVRGGEDINAEGRFRVTVAKENLVPAGMKLEKLYHIHDDEVEELNTEETGDALVFEVANFSDVVASYTVDFDYKGVQWSFPGFGSYTVSSIMSQIGVEGNIDSVELLLIEGEEVENALYLEQDQEETWYLCSYAPFDEVYRLTVVVDGVTHILTVTDDQTGTWNVTIHLLDYDETSAASSEEMSVIRNKKYGILAIITDKSTGALAGYIAGGFKVEEGTGSDIVVNIEQKYRKVHVDGNNVIEDNALNNYDSETQNVHFRLYEGNIEPDQWQHQSFSNITSLPDSMTGFEFLPEPYGNIVNGNDVTMKLKRSYDKQYNLRFNIEPAGLEISDADEYYAFVTVKHATTETTYGYTKIEIPRGTTTADIPITRWYDWNGHELPNEKFTGNEAVTVQIYTNTTQSDGTKAGFNSFTAIRDSQVKVSVEEGSSINSYNLYYSGTRTSEDDDINHVTKYYDNLTLRAPNGDISKGDIDRYLEDATDFGYYTMNYVGHSGDIEATIGANYMDTDFLSDFGYSTANINVNRLKVLKIYTDSNGNPVERDVEIRLKQNGQTVATKSGRTNPKGRLELEFDGLNSGEYEIEEVIGSQVVSGKGHAEISGQTIYYNFSIDKAHFANNVNVNYFGTIGPNQNLDKLKTMLQKASRVDVVIITDTAGDKKRIDAAKEQQTTGKQIDVVLNGTSPYKHYDIPADMLKLKELSDDLANAQSSSTVRIINLKASQISENGLFLDDDGRYIVLNIEMDQDTFCPMVTLGGQLLDCDYGQSGKSNSSHVLYNLRRNGTYYDGDVNTSKLGAGVILAPAANAHVLGGPFGGTIITDRVNRMGNELHSNNPNQIQTLNATIQNTIGEPQTGSLELRKVFANASIKDKVTYFTFEVTLNNADPTKVVNQSFPASGLKKGSEVSFDATGKARVLVRAGNSVTIGNLPAGTTYTVQEIQTPETQHFTLDHYEVNGQRGNTGTIVGGDTSKAKVLNNIAKADLTIEKEVLGTTDEGKEFEFTLKLENKITGAEDTEENWSQYPDNYRISVAGDEYVVVNGSQNESYTFRLKAGQKAEIQDLAVDNSVIRYTVTETAVYVNNVRYEILPDNQPVKGYSNSVLVVTNHYTQGDRVVFVNEYSAATKVCLIAHKILQGRALTEGAFAFQLREDSPTGNVIGETKTNAQDGTVTFDDIEYTIQHRSSLSVADCMVGATIKADGTREKIFTYYICEVVPENPDPAIVYAEPVEVKVKVVDDGTGRLTAYYVQESQNDSLITVYDGQDQLTGWTFALPAAKNIVNSIKTQTVLNGTKTLIGRDMEAGEKFAFKVTEAIHNAETGENEDIVVATGEAAGGTNNTPVAIDFTPIEYVYSGNPNDYPQTHTYTITEDETRMRNGVTNTTGHVFTATVTVSYDAENKTFTATEPVYVPDPVAFINNWEERGINFTVSKEWLIENTPVFESRSITFSVTKDGEDFNLDDVEIVQANEGTGGFTKSGNTVTLTAGTNGWPVVEFTGVPEGEYVVTETYHSEVEEGNTFADTTYALNGTDKASNTEAAATQDGDAILIKNSETIPGNNRAELILKKVWDPAEFTDNADKKTVTYELYQVAASGTNGGSNVGGSKSIKVSLKDWGNNEIAYGYVSYEKEGDNVSVTINSTGRNNYTVQNNNSYGQNLNATATNGSVTVEFTIATGMAEFGLDLYTYDAAPEVYGTVTVSNSSGNITPLIVEQLTATPTNHATIIELGGTKYGEYELDQEHWNGVTVTVPKETDSTRWQYYVVEKNGDSYEAEYTQGENNTLIVTNTKRLLGSVQVTKTFSGIAVGQIPGNFRITATWGTGADAQTRLLAINSNGYDEGESYTDVSIENNGLTCTWTINNLPLDTEVTFTESGYEINGYVVTTTYDPGNRMATAAVDPGTVTITNTYTAGVELPATGGPGTALYTFLGLMILLLAGGLLVLNRRRGFGKNRS